MTRQTLDSIEKATAIKCDGMNCFFHLRVEEVAAILYSACPASEAQDTSICRAVTAAYNAVESVRTNRGR